MNISVVIPVYNSESLLHKLVLRLQPVLMKLAGEYELILVNDDSSDHSWEVIYKLVQEYEWIHGINLMRNYGQHNALLCGIRSAKYEVIITMDDDLQNPPEEIPMLIEKLDNYDVVYGTPQKEQHGFLRNIASQITKLTLQNAMGAETACNISAFRAFYTQVRDAFNSYRGPFLSIDVLLTWGTTRFTSVSVRHDSRQSGFSNYTIRMLISHAMNMMTGFSSLPLQLANIIGFVFTLFGLGVLCWVIGRYLIQGGSVPGFPFLASIIAIFSGAQLFALGIIGEYLSRMHFKMMERPTYTIRSVAHRD